MIKTSEDIKLIKHAAAIWKKVRTAMYENAQVGVSLNKLNDIAANIIKQNDATSAFYMYHGFPKDICISVNEVIIHGVPNEYILKNGDKVTFDVGVNYQDHFCDAAYTIIIGEADFVTKDINEVCYNSLMKAISILKPGVTNHEIASTIQDYVQQNGYEVIRNFTGHGCGNHLHEDPVISNYRSREFTQCTLKPNMVICIEPMILLDSHKFVIDKNDKWSVSSKNKKITCHWEHMVLITEDGYEILTE